MREHIWYTVTYKVEGASEFDYLCEHYRDRVEADKLYDYWTEKALREYDQTGITIYVGLFEQDDRFGSLIPKRQKTIG